MDECSSRSFAFWYTKKNKNNNCSLSGAEVENDNNDIKNSDELTAVMNFNLWSQCGWNNEPFLDIGFKLTNLQIADELHFFLPFYIDENDKMICIEDLGCKFNKTELVDAVFNDSYSTTIAANTKCIDVSRNDGKDNFTIYQLDVEHDISLDYFAGGTIINIKTDRIYSSLSAKKSEKYYFRFRIKNKALGFLIHKYSPPAGAFQALFNETYMIDFRYHNIRSLHKTLIEKFNETNNAIVKVEALHFLLMTKAYVEILDNNYRSVRKIEKDVWTDYIGNSYTDDILAYHYAEKQEKKAVNIGDTLNTNANLAGNTKPRQITNPSYLKSCEIFTKFKVEKSLIWTYILLTLGIGFVGSLVCEVLFRFID